MKKKIILMSTRFVGMLAQNNLNAQSAKAGGFGKSITMQNAGILPLKF